MRARFNFYHQTAKGFNLGILDLADFDQDASSLTQISFFFFSFNYFYCLIFFTLISFIYA